MTGPLFHPMGLEPDIGQHLGGQAPAVSRHLGTLDVCRSVGLLLFLVLMLLAWKPSPVGGPEGRGQQRGTLEKCQVKKWACGRVLSNPRKSLSCLPQTALDRTKEQKSNGERAPHLESSDTMHGDTKGCSRPHCTNTSIAQFPTCGSAWCRSLWLQDRTGNYLHLSQWL